MSVGYTPREVRHKPLGGSEVPEAKSVVHSVSKNCANLFLSELSQISTNLVNFWQKDDKEARIKRGALISHLT